MSRVEEIEAAIESLSSEEFQSVVDWVRKRDQARWDEQMDQDSAAGRLDFLFAEPESEGVEGLLRDWPPQSSNH